MPKESWRIPPKADAVFVCQMEDVLDVYKRAYDPKQPQICMDEMPKQLPDEKYEPLPGKPGHLESKTMNTSDMATPISSCCSSPWQAGVLLKPIHIANP